MKNIVFGAVAALALGVASFAVPASAATPSVAGISQPSTDISAQRVVRRTTIVRRGPVCSVRVVRTRGPMGRVVVRKTRVCR